MNAPVSSGGVCGRLSFVSRRCRAVCQCGSRGGRSRDQSGTMYRLTCGDAGRIGVVIRCASGVGLELEAVNTHAHEVLVLSAERHVERVVEARRSGDDGDSHVGSGNCIRRVEAVTHRATGAGKVRHHRVVRHALMVSECRR